MRFSLSMALGLAAIGLAATGCTSSSSPAGPAAASTPASAALSSPATAAGSSPATAAGSSPASAAAASATCPATGLRYALGATSGTGGQRIQTVVLTNEGSSSCTLAGFPGVDLVGAARSQQNYTWPLVRQSVRYSAVTLAPGGAAHFEVSYLPSNSGSSGAIAVDKMVITPPNDFTQAELTWDQPVLLQDAATHPGTYIGPVEPGS